MRVRCTDKVINYIISKDGAKVLEQESTTRSSVAMHLNLTLSTRDPCYPSQTDDPIQQKIKSIWTRDHQQDLFTRTLVRITYHGQGRGQLSNKTTSAAKASRIKIGNHNYGFSMTSLTQYHVLNHEDKISDFGNQCLSLTRTWKIFLSMHHQES